MSDPTPAAGRFSASIFDMDGLLIDSEILWHEAEIEILGDLGVPLSRDGCRSTKGMFVGEVTEYWYARYPWTGPTPRRGGGDRSSTGSSPCSWPKESSSRAREHAIALCAERGLPLAVASSSQYRLIDTALEHFGLRHHFALVHSAEDETWGKPHPAVFLTAAAKLGATPRRCLVWEDAPAGVLAAKAASMACIAVPEHGEEQPAGLRPGRRGARVAARNGRAALRRLLRPARAVPPRRRRRMSRPGGVGAPSL